MPLELVIVCSVVVWHYWPHQINSTRFVSISILGGIRCVGLGRRYVLLISELCRICLQSVTLLMRVLFFDFQCVCQVLTVYYPHRLG